MLRTLVSPGNCSAFVATGGYTRDHHIVMAHKTGLPIWTASAGG